MPWNWGTMFDSLSTMGEDVTLHRLQGYVSSGGHHSPVFAGASTQRVVVRPWESDVMQQGSEGATGQTTGHKVYAPASLNLKRGDRIHYRDGEFKLMNPQYDQLNDLERWDMKEDDRQFRLASNVADGVEIEPPQSDFGGY